MITQSWQNRCRQWLLGLLALHCALLTILSPHSALAFFSKLHYTTEQQGTREVISFMIPPGASHPSIKMLDLVTLQITVPGLLALPATALRPESSKWIKSFEMSDSQHGDKMGILLTLGLKTPHVNYRDSIGEYDPIDGALYRLELDPPVIPTTTGAAKLLDGTVLAGRDGTLLLLEYTGNGTITPTLDIGLHRVHIDWPGATLSPSWRPIAPQGLITSINTYPFKNKVEMEITLHDSVSMVNFPQDPATGLFMASIRSKDGLGRHDDTAKILAQRRQAIDEKQPQPLHQIGTTYYVNYPKNRATLNNTEVDELYYLNNAKEAEHDRQYAKARGYVDQLLNIFPLTKNREYLEFYKFNMANHMDWKSGWLLTELNNLLARYPNNANYPSLRFRQLQLLNDASQFQEAYSIQWDPNLPTDNHLVWLERGRTAMGLAYSKISPEKNLTNGEAYLQKVLDYTRNQGSAAAEAQFLLVQIAVERGDHAAAIKLLDQTPPEQMAYIANWPERLMESADIYYKSGRYSDAIKLYTQVLSLYPTHPSITPWAMLRTAESNRQLSRVDDASRMFDRLKSQYASSDAAVWGQIFQLQLEKDRDINERLKELGKIMQALHLPKEQTDAFTDQIKQLLLDTNRHWDIKKTLDKLAAMKKDYPKIDQKVWDQIPILQENMEKNFNDRLVSLDKIIQDIALPEALAEAYMTKAAMLGEAGRHKEVLETLNQLLTISSRDNMISRAKEYKHHYLLEGMAKALDAGKPEYTAMLGEIYGADWRDDPAFVPARIFLAEAMLRMGLNEAALRFLKGIPGDTATKLTQLSTTAINGQNTLFTPSKNGESLSDITPAVARVQLDEAARQVRKQNWEGVLNLLNNVPEKLYNPSDRIERWRLLAKAEAALERFPQAVQHMEDLLFGRPMDDGVDYYWYASILHKWKGDTKALPAFKRVAAEAKNKEIQALAHIRIGEILQRSGDFNEAQKEFLAVKALAPSTPWSQVSAENAAQLGMALDVTP